MKRWMTSLASLCMAASAYADVPRLIHYQGKLVTDAGAIVTGPVNLRARLYDSPGAPAPVLFDETHSGVALNRGLFSVLLGSQTGGGVPDSAFAGSSVYLGIAVDGAAELSPRIRIATSPFAGKSRSAEQLVLPGTSTPAAAFDGSGRLGVGTLSPDPSAAMHISSMTGGLLPPSMDETARNAIPTPATGLLIFNTTSNCYNMWDGSTWRQSCFECTFTPPTAGNSGPICEGQTLNLTATSVGNAVYQWSGPNAFSSADQNPSISTATTSASGPYSVTATVDGCTSNPVTTLATVNAIPTAPTIGSNGPLCAGNTLLLTANAVPGAAYSWIGPNAFTSNLQNPSIPNAATAAGGMYTLEVTVNGCMSPPATINVAVNAIPATPGTISGPSSPCINSTGVVYSISDVPGATSYTWTAPNGSTIASGQGTAFATVNFGTQSGDLTVTASNACGTSGAQILTLTLGGASNSQTFSPTGSGRNGSIQMFTVPACVTSITIEAWGAQGSDGNAGQGGLGARMRGTFAATPGTTLKILVGHRGVRAGGGCEGGGGGGTFVTDQSDNPLIVAGGGGGSSSDSTGSGGTTSTGGLSGDGGASGGSGGSGGGSAHGAAGGGLLGDGPNAQWNGGSLTQSGGRSFVNGGTGGLGESGSNPTADGGFGGGGASHGNCCIGGGGAGGYSGGGGAASCRAGGGAGSFNAGSDQNNSSAAQSGAGQVVISW